jgi:hypothetical protein
VCIERVTKYDGTDLFPDLCSDSEVQSESIDAIAKQVVQKRRQMSMLHTKRCVTC